ncbi:hypothetical protein [Aeromonas veronii]|uniref:hypothetical protein n=1 Tax=Aeromonas veronii TaxID=654 RepID=UPI0013DEC5D6|nr:hypothetical protein [Aeromonas veronii]QIF44823.1 hypothetical protein EO082_12860 [Aeromonas veronii]
MEQHKIESVFLSLWRRALNLPSLKELTVDLINSWLEQKHLTATLVEETEVGEFERIKCIVLTLNNQKACFPKMSSTCDENWIRRNEIIKEQIELWSKMEWFFPLWIPLGDIHKLLKAVRYQTQENAIQLFNYHTSTNYTLAFQAICISQLLPKSEVLNKYLPIAREAYLAFYAGHRASSIAALIPTIEGALTNIMNEHPELTPKDKINKMFDGAIQKEASVYFEHMWVPKEYTTEQFLLCLDERVLFFSTYRNWLLNSFFQNTKEYSGVTWLNRHVFAHAESSAWQDSGNFCRLIVALATMGVVESWYKSTNSISLFFPEMNEDSKLLWQQTQLQAQMQMYIKMFEEKNYHKHGRLVPEMPTDNGITLRKAILSEDCVKDLVRPLRDAGWSIDIGEPDDQALFIKVVAKSKNQSLKISLLYSCATDNKLYRELAEDSDVILYRGSPYHQAQYAYGISVYVGPVTGWQPPAPPKY